MVLALDVGDLTSAEAIARRVAPWFGVAKVGHELYAEAGPVAFERLHALGYAVFCDLKLHDIPNTVERAARAHARHGVELMNAHAVGGEVMLRAFVAGAREGAREAGLPAPVTLGVTVLTSEPDASEFASRLETARLAGCDGVVCSTHEIAAAHAAGMQALVPGIRFAGGAVHDQARVATPQHAAAAGADWLVIGRAVTASENPEAAAAEAGSQVERGLTAR
ncbi:MAG: orotidine-5'-phosphate decarboxylase [Actinobacteria bacterium]|nr:orotidine-5'-phosphate decarboxylase [Actinomycetota bacterium]